MKFLIVKLSLLAMFIAGCAGNEDVSRAEAENQAFDDLRTEIRFAIDDSERETKAVAIVDELAGELESLSRSKAERQEQIRKLNANYDTTRAEFDAFTKASNNEIRLNQQRILEKRKALIEVTTPEEWDRIFDARSAAIDAAIKSAQLN